jgi:hypothetical protein
MFVNNRWRTSRIRIRYDGYGTEDPDPCKNLTDPEHCRYGIKTNFQSKNGVYSHKVSKKVINRCLYEVFFMCLYEVFFYIKLVTNK